MTYTVESSTVADLPELATIRTAAMSTDLFWKGMIGPVMTTEQEEKMIYNALLPYFVQGIPLGTYEAFKVVDDDGKILAWCGITKPNAGNTSEMAVPQQGYQLLPSRNEKIYQFFINTVGTLPQKHGHDPAKHFERFNIMVLPEYQRQGLGRLLTRKTSELADAAGAATYVKCRPGAAAMFVQMGYEQLDRVDVDLDEYGIEAGKTAFFCLKREPGAEEDRGKRLNWS